MPWAEAQLAFGAFDRAAARFPRLALHFALARDFDSRCGRTEAFGQARHRRSGSQLRPRELDHLQN